MKRPILYYSNLFFAKQFYDLGKKFLRTPHSLATIYKKYNTHI